MNWRDVEASSTPVHRNGRVGEDVAASLQGRKADLLEVRHLRTEFATEDGVVHAVNDVSFHVDDGEILAIVGESGSGKSVTMLSIMGLIPRPPGRIVSGEVIFEGRDLLGATAQKMQEIRGSRVAMVFQEPLSSLNPVFTLGDQIAEVIRYHESASGSVVRRRVHELIEAVGIPNPERIAKSYPHQISGGMCQRIMLAIGIACRPRLLIADEPTTALDVTTQAQLLDLVRDMQAGSGMAIVWITHDLGIVAGLAHRVQVMYAGRIVETAPVDVLYQEPLHPYTIALLRCVPRLDQDRITRLPAIPGVPPDMIGSSTGCPFASRCSFALERCHIEEPSLEQVAPGHQRACWAPPATLRARRDAVVT